MLSVVDLPEFVLGIVCSCVHPLEAAELTEFLLDGAVLHDEGIMVKGTGTPDTDVEEHLSCLTCLLFLGFVAVG